MSTFIDYTPNWDVSPGALKIMMESVDKFKLTMDEKWRSARHLRDEMVNNDFFGQEISPQDVYDIANMIKCVDDDVRAGVDKLQKPAKSNYKILCDQILMAGMTKTDSFLGHEKHQMDMKHIESGLGIKEEKKCICPVMDVVNFGCKCGGI